jgi:DNA-binding NarL/FixJ family response regulator
MKQKIKFAIVDDQRIVRESLSEKLKFLFSDAEVVQADSARNILALIEKFMPDIVFMDISMPDMDGIEASRLILSEFPLQKIISFSMNDDGEMRNKMIKAGAKGYLLKTDDAEDYLAAINSVLKGEIFTSRNLMK